LTGDIERYGTGTLEMCKRSEEQGLTTPQFTLPDGFNVCLWRETAHVTAHVTDHVTDHVDELIRRLVLVLFGEMDRQKLMDALQLRHRVNFMEKYIRPSLEEEYIEMTTPDKPKSVKQKYRLTQKGQKLKAEMLRKQ
jgi:hypothetical protein